MQVIRAIIGAGMVACLIGVITAVGPRIGADGFVAAAQANETFDEILRRLGRNKLPAGFVQANGRLEAEQVDVAAKLPGRLTQVLAEEGQIVDAGAVVARLDSTEIEAQLRAARAQVQRAERAKEQAEAAIAQRDSERTLAKQELDRTITLQDKGYATSQLLDQRRNQMNTADAAYRVAIAAQAEAVAAVEATHADVARLESVLDDTVLKAPRRGRVQYKLMQAGEVAGAGSRIVTLIDLADIYMTVFLPARAAGRLSLGDEARLILDPVPDYVVPGTVSFVAAEAQFTPKTVETADEREKLMFRVKLKIAPDLLKTYESRVKTGVRGVAFVRMARDADWPKHLVVKLPQ
jgi:HlyD family secretion protein